MRVLILTHGTRGDVQPYLALAQGLLAAGHSAVLGAPSSVSSLAKQYGVEVVPFEDSARQLMESPQCRALAMTKRNRLDRIKSAVQAIHIRARIRTGLLTDLAKAGQDNADVVVHSYTLPGNQIAERIGVNAVPVCLTPNVIPTKSFPDPRISMRLPAFLNYPSYAPFKARDRTIESLIRLFGTDAVTTWRQDVLGLPYRSGHRNTLRRPDGAPAKLLQAFSRHVLPSPLNYPEWVHTVGFWRLSTPPNWRPPQDLDRFLSAGEAPVYVGFGSMVGTDPKQTGRIIIEAIRVARVRAVVCTGWGGIQNNLLDEGIYYLNEAPHDWLFPRMSAIIHHGGAGTTAAALAAGRPQVVCPFLGDQPFNARRMHASGVATAPQPHVELNGESLGRAIRLAVRDRSMALRAEEFSCLIRNENAIHTTIRFLESAL